MGHTKALSVAMIELIKISKKQNCYLIHRILKFLLFFFLLLKKQKTNIPYFSIKPIIVTLIFFFFYQFSNDKNNYKLYF